MMATRRKDEDGDTDVMERDERKEGRELTTQPEQQPAAPEQQVVMMTGGDPLTVTVANPTPPTNYSYNNYGTPPTAPGAAFVDDGAPGATTAIAAPLSVNPPKGPAAEATGTVVIDADVNNSPSITVMGAYTNTPNASHPSSAAPTTLPTITAVAPDNIAGTGGTANLTVTGTGFTQQSKVSVSGTPLQTQFNSTTQLLALNAPKRTSAGILSVTVVTGGVGTATSPWTFT